MSDLERKVEMTIHDMRGKDEECERESRKPRDPRPR